MFAHKQVPVSYTIQLSVSYIKPCHPLDYRQLTRQNFSTRVSRVWAAGQLTKRKGLCIRKGLKRSERSVCSQSCETWVS